MFMGVVPGRTENPIRVGFLETHSRPLHVQAFGGASIDPTEYLARRPALDGKILCRLLVQTYETESIESAAVHSSDSYSVVVHHGTRAFRDLRS
jgi:hypothetical protein